MWAIKTIDFVNKKKTECKLKTKRMNQIEIKNVGPRAKPKKLKNENYLFEKVRPVCC